MSVIENVVTRAALGGSGTIGLVFDQAEIDGEILQNRLWLEVFQFESAFSRFLPGSELTRFNEMAGQQVCISPEFRELLESSIEMSLESDGLFNPFILPTLQRSGYVNSTLEGYEDDNQADFSDRKVTGTDSLQLSGEYAEIPYNTALDFGGCGKGYLAKKLVKEIRSSGAVGGWVAFDGDIAAFGTDAEGGQICVGVQSAIHTSDRLDMQIEIPVDGMAVATSGTLKRQAHEEKVGWHHIINPLTFKPAETDIVLATVIDEDALRADVLASSVVILGSSAGEAYLHRKGVDGWILQFRKSDGSIAIKKQGSMFLQTSPQLIKAAK